MNEQNNDTVDIENRAAELLQNNEYYTIATVNSYNKPWNSPVYAVYDKHLNFFWSSWKKAEHSKNITHNPHIFFTLYDSTRKRGDNNRRCLYVKGKAYEITEENDITKALKLLYPSNSAAMLPQEFLDNYERRIYCATPLQAWLNDLSEREVTKETVKMRVEVSLDRLKPLITQQSP